MVIPTRACPSDTSASSELDELSFDEKRVQIFAKQMLHGRLFMGSFQERRYVESLNAYRDVVCISRVEQELIQDILVVKQRVEELHSKKHWVGITTPDTVGTPASYSVWVELPENTIFGAYWFKIRRMKFNNNESCLRIKLIRPLPHDICRAHKESREKSNVPSEDIYANVRQDINENVHYFLQNVTTFANLKESLKFLIMLLATILVSLFEILKYLSEFLLKFMNEFSKLTKSFAPIFQIAANLIERLFRTLCMLIAFLIKGRSPVSQPYPNRYPGTIYTPYQNLRALPATPRQRGVIIEEIE